MQHKQEAPLVSKQRNAQNKNDQYVVCLELCLLVVQNVVRFELCLLFLLYKMITVCLKALVKSPEACWIL